MKRKWKNYLENLSDEELEETIKLCFDKKIIEKMNYDGKLRLLNIMLDIITEQIDLKVILETTTKSLSITEKVKKIYENLKLLKIYTERFNKEYFQKNCKHEFSEWVRHEWNTQEKTDPRAQLNGWAKYIDVPHVEYRRKCIHCDYEEKTNEEPKELVELRINKEKEQTRDKLKKQLEELDNK